MEQISCLMRTQKLSSNWPDRYNRIWQIKSIARSLNIHFPLFHIAEMKNQLDNLNITSTPITFLVDLTMNKIIYANASLPYYESGTEEFSKKLQLLLDDCN